MHTVEALTKELRETVEPDTALWFSGGKASRLLFECIVKAELEVTTYRFDETWNNLRRVAVQEVADRLKRSLYSYRPMDFMIFGNGENKVSIGAVIPTDRKGGCGFVVEEFRPTEGRCIFDMRSETQPSSPVHHALYLVGGRKDAQDYSYYTPGKVWLHGASKWVAPLYEWTLEEIEAALAELGVADTWDDSSIDACVNCLISNGEPVYCPKAQAEIPAHDWDPRANLNVMRDLQREAVTQ